MALTPDEERILQELSDKASVVEKPKTLIDILHKIISFLGVGPVHDELHEAIDGLPEPGPGPAGPPGPPGPAGPAGFVSDPTGTKENE